MDFHCRVLACAWFLVSADVVAQKSERASEKRREERMREPVSIFTNTSIHPLSRLREETVSRVKVTKVKMSRGGFHSLDVDVLVAVGSLKL